MEKMVTLSFIGDGGAKIPLTSISPSPLVPNSDKINKLIVEKRKLSGRRYFFRIVNAIYETTSPKLKY